MLASFNGTWDWTAVGTLALAAVTLALAAATFWMVKLTRSVLTQNRDEIALSRREVDEAHRPVLVPLSDSRPTDILGVGRTSARPAVPSENQLAIPIENIGTGPALRIETTVELLNEEGDRSAAGTGGVTLALIAGIKASGSVVPIVGVHGLRDVPGFWLTLTYEDVAGKGWITKARYIKTRDRYEDLTVNTLDEGAYGLRQDRQLLKPVS
jgi:hypothetical protein